MTHFRVMISAGFLGALFVWPLAADTDLLGAVRKGDAVGVAVALETGAPEPKALGRPLFFAAQQGHAEVVALLLGAGADPNTVFTFGSPLHAAARADHADIVKMLLDQGAEPDLAAGDFRQSPLHEAAARGAIDAARLLLDRGADVNFRNRHGRPAIHVAVAAGQTAMADFLREKGAAPDLPDPVTQQELAGADLEAGRLALFGCNTCHEVAKDRPATGVHVGPSLVGIFGSAQAAQADYAYSDAMKRLDGTWTAETLNAFLTDPTGLVPGTEMLRVPEMTRAERIGLISLLKQSRE